MAWTLAAMVAMKMIQGASDAKNAANTSIAQNKAIMAYNKNVMAQTLTQVTQINLQRAQQRQDSTAALFNVQNQGMSARDQITQQAAATDTIGASVNDAIATVNQKQDQAQGSVYDQYQRAIDQSNAMIQKTVDSGTNAFRDPVNDQSNAVMNAAGWSAAGSVIGAAAGKMTGPNTGDGTTPTTPATSTLSGSHDYQGFNSNQSAGSNPFGLSFGFQSNNLLGN